MVRLESADTVANRRILLAVTGLSPQVVTETLYGLMREGPQALPDEVHVLSTGEGADRVRLSLLSQEPGWFARFLSDYALEGIAFSNDHVHVLCDGQGRELDDIRSAEQNMMAADQISALVRELTSDPGSQLHVSLAGGRKTLGFFAGYALSLWGRPGDRLSHVLVDEPFESSWDFFYPTPYVRVIKTRDDKLADCAQAQVTLADIPFVRLRHGLPRRLLAGDARFSEAVSAVQAHIGAPRLVVDLAGREVLAGERSVTLPPAQLAFLAWFARRALGEQPPLAAPKVPDPDYAEAYLREYRSICGSMGDDERTSRRHAQGMDKEAFEQLKCQLNKRLRDALGLQAQPYLVVGQGRRPQRFGLALAPAQIDFACLPKGEAT